MTTDPRTEQEAFDKWRSDHLGQLTDNELYKLVAWRAWQARAAIEQEKDK